MLGLRFPRPKRSPWELLRSALFSCALVLISQFALASVPWLFPSISLLAMLPIAVVPSLLDVVLNAECALLLYGLYSRVCGNPHAIIRKYGLMFCRQCFRSNAKEIGFIKSGSVSLFTCSVYLLPTCGFDLGTLALISPEQGKTAFLPVFRSGSCSEIGPKSRMEDEHVCIDNLVSHLGASVNFLSPGAFYGVFDGHGGSDAACFVKNNILKYIIDDKDFPVNVDKALKSAFLKADLALADSTSLDRSSGTTALTALIFGRSLLIANAGDCRAVLGKHGRAIELSRDHKPNCKTEQLRIEKLGGSVFDGYLNGQLSVARALGDWHMKGPKGSAYPLIAEPELQETILTKEDEFLIMGCDGLWDVMSSQCAVTITRKELMQHNDPEKCARELVREALKRNTCDNLTVVVVCFSSDPPPSIEIPRTRVRRSISLEGLHVLKGALDTNI